MVSREPASRSAEISFLPCAMRALFSSRQIRLSSEGSTSAFAQLGAACDEAHDRLGDFLGDESSARLQHGGQRLLAVHARKPHAVLRDRRHHALESLEVRQVVLAQRNEDAVVGAANRSAPGPCRRFPALPRAHVGTVLDQVREVLDELGGAPPAGVVALAESEDLLELVEDQQRDDGLAVGIPQDVVAMVQELPERLALDGAAGLRPLARVAGRPEDRLLDLFRRRRGFRRIVDAHVHRAIAFRSQPRHDSGAQDGRLAEARLPEQDREQLALHAPAELGDLFLAAMEIAACFLRIGGQSQPGMLRVQRRRDAAGVRRDLSAHDAPRSRPDISCCSRCTNAGAGSPPRSSVMCSALKRSGMRAPLPVDRRRRRRA